MAKIDFFGAKWCVACHASKELWQKYATKYGHTLNYIDVDEQPEEAGEAGIRGLPTVLIGAEQFNTVGPSEIEKVCSRL